MTGFVLNMISFVLTLTGFDEDDEYDESNEMACIAVLTVPCYQKHRQIAKGCHEYILSVVKVSSCSNQKTSCQKLIFSGIN